MADKLLDAEAYEFWSKKAVNPQTGKPYYDPSIFGTITVNGPFDGEELDYDKLQNRESFIRSAQACYRVFSGKESDPNHVSNKPLDKLTKEDLHFLKNYVQDELRWFNNNMGSTLNKARLLQNADPIDKLGVFYQMNIFDKTDWSWGGFARALGISFLDPWNIASAAIGTVTFGAGTVATQGAKAAVKYGAVKTITAGLTLGAIDGAAYSAAKQYALSEEFTINGRKIQRKQFSWNEMGVDTAFGAGFGAGFSTFGRYVIRPRWDAWSKNIPMAKELYKGIFRGAWDYKYYFHMKSNGLLSHLRTYQDNSLVRLYLSLNNEKHSSGGALRGDYLGQHDLKKSLTELDNSFKQHLGTPDSASGKFANTLHDAKDDIVKIQEELQKAYQIQDVYSELTKHSKKLERRLNNIDGQTDDGIKDAIDKTINSISAAATHLDPDSATLLKRHLDDLQAAAARAINDLKTGGATKEDVLDDFTERLVACQGDIHLVLRNKKDGAATKLKDLQKRLDEEGSAAIQDLDAVSKAAEEVHRNSSYIARVVHDIKMPDNATFWEGGSPAARVGVLRTRKQTAALIEYGDKVSSEINGQIDTFSHMQANTKLAIDQALETLNDNEIPLNQAFDTLEKFKDTLDDAAKKSVKAQEEIKDNGSTKIAEMHGHIDTATDEMEDLMLNKTKDVGRNFLSDGSNKSKAFRFVQDYGVGHVEKRWDELSPDIQKEYLDASKNSKAFLETLKTKYQPDLENERKKLEKLKPDDKAGRAAVFAEIHRIEDLMKSHVVPDDEIYYVPSHWIPGEDALSHHPGRNADPAKWIEGHMKEYATAQGTDKATVSKNILDNIEELLRMNPRDDGWMRENAVMQSVAWGILNHAEPTQDGRKNGLHTTLLEVIESRIKERPDGDTTPALKSLLHKLTEAKAAQKALAINPTRGPWREMYDMIRNRRYPGDFMSEYSYEAAEGIRAESVLARNWEHGWGPGLGDSWIGRNFPGKHKEHRKAVGRKYFEYVRPIHYPLERTYRHFLRPLFKRRRKTEGEGEDMKEVLENGKPVYDEGMASWLFRMSYEVPYTLLKSTPGMIGMAYWMAHWGRGDMTEALKIFSDEEAFQNEQILLLTQEKLDIQNELNDPNITAARRQTLTNRQTQIDADLIQRQQILASIQQATTQINNPAVNNQQQQSATNNPPAATANPPAATANPPAATANPPAATANPPAATANPPAATANPPAATTNPPAVTTNPPAVTTNPPAVTTNPPAVTTNPPAVTTNPPVQPAQLTPEQIQADEAFKQALDAYAADPTNPNLAKNLKDAQKHKTLLNQFLADKIAVQNAVVAVQNAAQAAAADTSNPALQKQLETAQKHLAKVQKQQDERIEKELKKQAEELAEYLEEEIEKTKKALEADPDNEDLKKKLADTEAQLAKAKKGHDKIDPIGLKDSFSRAVSWTAGDDKFGRSAKGLLNAAGDGLETTWDFGKRTFNKVSRDAPDLLQFVGALGGGFAATWAFSGILDKIKIGTVPYVGTALKVAFFVFATMFAGRVSGELIRGKGSNSNTQGDAKHLPKSEAEETTTKQSHSGGVPQQQITLFADTENKEEFSEVVAFKAANSNDYIIQIKMDNGSTFAPKSFSDLVNYRTQGKQIHVPQDLLQKMEAVDHNNDGQNDALRIHFTDGQIEQFNLNGASHQPMSAHAPGI